MGVDYPSGIPGPAVCTWDSDPSHITTIPAGPNQGQLIYDFFAPEPQPIPDMDQAPANGTLTTLFSRKNASFNSTADQALTQTFNFSACTIQFISINGATIPLTTAKGGIYTGPGKTGTAILPATQSYAGLVTSLDVINPMITISGQRILTPATFYLSLTTPQGSPCTANVSLMGLAG